MAITKIEWATHSINPIRVRGGKVWKHGYHCTKVSPGCQNCYAEKMNMMRGTGLPYDNRKVEYYLDLSVFDTLPKTKPAIVFVQSMGDLFHKEVHDDWIDEVMGNIIENRLHKFLILTKRPKRMHEYFEYRQGVFEGDNYWLGVSCENQQAAGERIGELFKIPATVRFVSLEPLLGEVSLVEHQPFRNKKYGNNLNGIWGLLNPLHWVIVGCESGHNRRECKLAWVRSIVGQCKDADVPVFVKQLNINGEVEKDMSKFPEDLQIREYPA